ncbi:PREDICTED: uncharacterized protein LOC109380136 [Hipposideros armiger]|uniref:Uncharacterized protein LOC109380136 n=1 Tax=Hipposideros armiger TaxID=186990 RepID=A0A8B7QYS8_HIPAR|nr:PREDICTED: uncharacterized protein LOC109380136 [Hipposideros armiger]
MFAVSRVNLIAAGSETRFPGRKQHVTTPDPQGSPPTPRAGQCGAPRRLAPHASVLLDPASYPHLVTQPLLQRPKLGSRGVEKERGSGGVHAGVVPIQVGDLSVKLTLLLPPSSMLTTPPTDSPEGGSRCVEACGRARVDPGRLGTAGEGPQPQPLEFPAQAATRPSTREWGLGGRGVQGGDEARCSPPPPTWALSHRNVGGGSSFRRPRHRIVGGSAWQPPGECPRRAPKPGPPLTRDSLPLLLWRGGGRGPGSQPWKEARGRGAGAGLLLPFLASSSGRCPLLPLGPERGEASRRRRSFRGGLLHSPSGAAGLQLELEGGQLEGGARGAPVAVLGAGHGAWMDLTACVSACVCSLRRRPGPTRPVRPPHASEVRVPGPESGGGAREGQGRGAATAL